MRIQSYSEYEKAVKIIERKMKNNSLDDMDELMDAVIDYESNVLFDVDIDDYEI